VLFMETKLRLNSCMVVTPPHPRMSWTLSRHVIDILEVIHNCFLGQSKGTKSSPHHIVCTADLQGHQTATVPMGFILAKQRASFIGKLIRTEHGQPPSKSRV